MAGRLVVALLPLACVAYAAIALASRHAWTSAIAGVLVGAFLWARLPRARFAAYVFFTAMAIRGVATAAWPAVAFAVAAVLLMQTPSARAAWPRLVLGRVRGDRMPPP